MPQTVQHNSGSDVSWPTIDARTRVPDTSMLPQHVAEHREPGRSNRAQPDPAAPQPTRGSPMPMNTRDKRPIDRQQPTPQQGTKAPLLKPDLPLAHERDQSIDVTADAPDPKMVQAKRDLDAGLVDTDMRATPGLDAKRRANLVPGPGGKPPSAGG